MWKIKEKYRVDYLLNEVQYCNGEEMSLWSDHSIYECHLYVIMILWIRSFHPETPHSKKQSLKSLYRIRVYFDQFNTRYHHPIWIVFEIYELIVKGSLVISHFLEVFGHAYMSLEFFKYIMIW